MNNNSNNNRYPMNNNLQTGRYQKPEPTSSQLESMKARNEDDRYNLEKNRPVLLKSVRDFLKDPDIKKTIYRFQTSSTKELQDEFNREVDQLMSKGESFFTKEELDPIYNSLKISDTFKRQFYEDRILTEAEIVLKREKKQSNDGKTFPVFSYTVSLRLPEEYQDEAGVVKYVTTKSPFNSQKYETVFKYRYEPTQDRTIDYANLYLQSTQRTFSNVIYRVDDINGDTGDFKAKVLKILNHSSQREYILNSKEEKIVENKKYLRGDINVERDFIHSLVLSNDNLGLVFTEYLIYLKKHQPDFYREISSIDSKQVLEIKIDAVLMLRKFDVETGNDWYQLRRRENNAPVSYSMNFIQQSFAKTLEEAREDDDEERAKMFESALEAVADHADFEIIEPTGELVRYKFNRYTREDGTTGENYHSYLPIEGESGVVDGKEVVKKYLPLEYFNTWQKVQTKDTTIYDRMRVSPVVRVGQEYYPIGYLFNEIQYKISVQTSGLNLDYKNARIKKSDYSKLSYYSPAEKPKVAPEKSEWEDQPGPVAAETRAEDVAPLAKDDDQEDDHDDDLSSEMDDEFDQE